MLNSILAPAAAAVIAVAFAVSLAALVYRLRGGRRW